MNRKVYLTVPLNLIIRVDEGEDILGMVAQLEISLPDCYTRNSVAEIEQFELGEPEITDSK